MRPAIVIFLVVVAVAASVLKHHEKYHDQRTSFDRLSEALSGLREVVSPTASVWVVNKSGYGEGFHQALHALVPVHLRQLRDGTGDTVLYIFKADDQAAYPNDSSEVKIWETKNEEFGLILTAKVNGKE